MKKLMAFAAALSLACPISFALPSTASADIGNGRSGVAALCQAGLAAYLGISQGNCVVLFSQYPTLTVNANTSCHYVQSNYPAYFALTYASFGDCVAQFNSAN